MDIVAQQRHHRTTQALGTPAGEERAATREVAKWQSTFRLLLPKKFRII